MNKTEQIKLILKTISKELELIELLLEEVEREPNYDYLDINKLVYELEHNYLLYGKKEELISELRCQ